MNKHLKYFILIIFLLLTVVIATGFLVSKKETRQNKTNDKEFSTLIINNKEYKVEVVKSEEDKAKGLSGRNSLQNIDGMLFYFDNSAIRNFWMKDMDFDLDFIWANNNKIIGLTKNVSHGNQTAIYDSPGDCNMVIELASGQIDSNNIKIGDNLELK